MPTVSAEPIAAASLAEVLAKLGDISPERIFLPIGTATDEDVLRLLDGDDKHICELIDGVLVEKTMGIRESRLAILIAYFIQEYLNDHPLGWVSGSDGPFRMRSRNVRFPDVSFVSWERYPESESSPERISSPVPDLAVEVLSAGNTPKEMKFKLREYFGKGVQLVWLVDPVTESAEVYQSATKKKRIGPDGAIEGGKVLPGFSLPLRKLFLALERKRR
jgi:Uma2 family endonuclease